MQKTASIENYTSEKASSSSVSKKQADHEQGTGEKLIQDLTPSYTPGYCLSMPGRFSRIPPPPVGCRNPFGDWVYSPTLKIAFLHQHIIKIFTIHK